VERSSDQSFPHRHYPGIHPVRGAPNSVARKIPARHVELNQAVIASDASDFAVASYCLAGLPYFEFLMDLSEEEKLFSSSRRELIDVDRTLSFLAKSRSATTVAATTVW
jgi:hypothetical protein